MNQTAEMHGPLPECDTSSRVHEMPIEDRQPALESMCLAARIDDELQGNVVRPAAVFEHRLRAQGPTALGERRLSECRLRDGAIGSERDGQQKDSYLHDDHSLTPTLPAHSLRRLVKGIPPRRDYWSDDGRAAVAPAE